MKNDDTLGDRMKFYEGMESSRVFLPRLPIIARIDGRSFSSFTKGMNRPFDTKMSHCMVETTKFLVEETNANIGYTQSDEISLGWYATDPKSQIFFGGRIMKMTSQLAALATLRFNQLIAEVYPQYSKKNPTFDARVWQVPTLEEATNCFLWREWDATKNSISMAASHFYSAKELHGKNGSQKQDMLMDKGINWNDYPSFFKRGTYIRRKVVDKAFDMSEIESLPAKHAARKNPNLIIRRSVTEILDLPPLTKVENKIETLFL